MMKYTNLTLLLMCAGLASCFKAEPLNSEADITGAYVHVDNPKDLFYNPSDTMAFIATDLKSQEIVFNNALRYADITNIAPHFTLSPGATITPASGTPQDFSQGGIIYKVTSEDGQWSREYNVRFAKLNQVYQYSFEKYTLSASGNYYIWSDLPETETPNWSTANAGFEFARSKTAKIEDYPTTPDPNGYKGSCVKLTTCSTGSWGALTNKRIAAGNLYLGTFDLGKALTETLKSTRFGTPTDRKPQRFSGFYKYKPGEELQENGKVVDGEDMGALYAVVYKNHDAAGNAVVLTGEDVTTSPQLVAMARVDMHNTDEWTSFDIPFAYTQDLDKETLKNGGYSFSVVCSSSENGDKYLGALGSTLWVDELSIQIEE